MLRVVHFEIPVYELTVPGVGYSASYQDTEGNVFGLFQASGVAQ